MNTTLLLALAAGGLLFVGLLAAFFGLFRQRVRIEERLNRGSKPAETKSWIDTEGIFNRIAGIIRPLGEVVPRSAEELAGACALGAREVARALAALELSRFALAMPGRSYVRSMLGEMARS